MTEIGTTATIMSLLALPLSPALTLLPTLGVMLNGTSSVLYGTVPELAPAARMEHTFALFYSCTLAPLRYGWLGGAAGPRHTVMAAGVAALLIVPLMIVLADRLAHPALNRPHPYPESDHVPHYPKCHLGRRSRRHRPLARLRPGCELQ